MGIEASRILKPGNSILRELESWLQVGFTWTNIHLGSTCCVGYPKTILITAHFYALLKHSLNVHIALTFLLEESATLNWFVLHIPAFARIYPCFFFNVFPMIFPCLSNKTNDSYQIFPLMFQIFRGFSHEKPPAPTVPPSRKGSNGSFARPKRGACVDVPRDMPCGNTWPWDKL